MAPLVERKAEARLPTRFGEFLLVGYEEGGGTEHLALVFGAVSGAEEVLVRVHSECLTGEAFGSLRCDCGPQLAAAMQRVSGAGRGVVLYSRGHEGRGIGLMAKLAAYALQDDGLDTVEANQRLGFEPDSRDYSAAVSILLDLGIRSVDLLSNNPGKREGLEAGGIAVARMSPLATAATDENKGYLEVKATKLGHLFPADGGT